MSSRVISDAMWCFCPVMLSFGMKRSQEQEICPPKMAGLLVASLYQPRGVVSRFRRHSCKAKDESQYLNQWLAVDGTRKQLHANRIRVVVSVLEISHSVRVGVS